MTTLDRPDADLPAAALVPWAVGQLMAKGKTPTLTAVRDLIGKGSFSTIKPALEQHMLQLHIMSKPGNTMPEHVIQSFQRIWREAVVAAGDQFTDQRVELESKVALLEVTKQAQDAEIQKIAEGQAAYLAELERLREAYNERQLEIEDRDRQLAEAKERMALADTEQAALASRIASLEKSMLEAEVAHLTQISLVRKEAEEALKTAVEREEKRGLEMEANALRRLSEAEATHQKIRARLEAELESVSKREKALATETADLRAKNSTLELARSALAEANATLGKHADDAKAALALSSERNQNLSEELIKLVNFNSQLQEELVGLRKIAPPQ